MRLKQGMHREDLAKHDAIAGRDRGNRDQAGREPGYASGTGRAIPHETGTNPLFIGALAAVAFHLGL